MAFPGTYNFNYYRGDKHYFKVYPKNSSGGALDLSPYSGAGATQSYIIANKRGSSGTQIVADAVIATDHVLCTITPSVGRLLTPGTHVYDVQLSDSASGEVITLITGTITVTDDIAGAVS